MHIKMPTRYYGDPYGKPCQKLPSQNPKLVHMAGSQGGWGGKGSLPNQRRTASVSCGVVM